ncbi:MAG: glutamate--cysteine ligase, partial [Zoogloea sp.]|nr:glutamate--cysteine ligase [Zoogloea sp.]
MTGDSIVLPAFGGYGLELEYMIVDRDSLAVVPLADELLEKAAGERVAEVARGRFGWSNELVLHLLEVKNLAPDADLKGLAAGFQAEVQAIDDLLEGFGACLMPTGMHPWMDPVVEARLWPHHNADIYRAYDRIFDCRTHGWANLQSMHLNLPFADDAEFARLHAAARLVLPILPAIAASSPIVEGAFSGMMDFRMQAYRTHPQRVPSLIGDVIPDNACSRADYESQVLAPMYRDIAAHDPDGMLRHEWLNARGAIPRFERNALEIRVIDVQECPRADVAVAIATAGAVRALYDGHWSTLAEQQAIDTRFLSGLMVACIKDADRAVLDDERFLRLFGFPGSTCQACELWRHLVEECDRLYPELFAGALAPLRVILELGPLARRIVRVLDDPVQWSQQIGRA